MPTLFVSNNVGGDEEEGDEELKLVGDDGNDYYVNVHALPPTGAIAVSVYLFLNLISLIK